MGPLLILFIFVALLFDYLNGFHDSANVVATVIPSKAMSPRMALAMTALTNLLGPFLFGVLPSFRVPVWVIAASASAIALGTAMGSWLLSQFL